MSAEEKLKAYIQENEVKPKSSKKVKSGAKTNAGQPAGMTPNWFMLRDVPYRFFILVMYMLAFLVIVGITLSKFVFDDDEALIYTLGAIIIIFISAAVVWLSRFAQYKKWGAGKFYPLAGWTELLASRSKVFWKKEFYISITIDFKLSDSATQLHQEAITVFLTNAISSKQKYADMEWHAGGYPSDFKATKTSMTGDVDSNALKWVVDTLSKKFIDLSRILGNALERVTIEYNGQEREFRHKYQGPSVHDRNDSRSTRQSLNG